MAEIYSIINGQWRQMRVVRQHNNWFRGWVCPTCNKVNSPYATICPCSIVFYANLDYLIRRIT